MGLRYIGPFRIISWVGKVAYQFDMSNGLSQIHNTFHVSQLQKCLADDSAVVCLDDIHVDEHLNYVERLIAILNMRTQTLCNMVVGMVKVQ